MPEFNDIFKKDEPTAPVGQTIDGTFECQECQEWVYEAVYDNLKKLLVWTCSNGHVSFIKDFGI